MRRPTAAALAIVAAAATFMSVAGQSPTTLPAKTPWGDPDLQGIWDSKTQTPLQWPDRYAGREFLTDEEVAILNKRALEDPGRDARPEKGSLLDVAEAYNNIWNSSFGARVVHTKRTSLIVDPADGKLPPLRGTTP